MARVATQQDQDQVKRFFNPDSDWGPPTDPSAAAPPTPAASAPAAAVGSNPTPTPNVQPPAATPAAAQSSSDQNYMFKPVNGDAFMEPRPVTPLDNVHGFRKALALAFGGLDSFGAGLQGKQGTILPSVINSEQAQRQYDASAPQMRARAEMQAGEANLRNQGTAAATAHTGAETDLTKTQNKNLQLVGPPGKQEFLKEFAGKLQTGEFDPQSLFNEYTNRGGAFGVTRQDLVNLVNSTAEQPAQAKIGPQGIAEPIMYHGRMWNGTEPDAPDVVKKAFQVEKPVETTIHNNKLQEQSAAAARITMGSELGEQRKNLETGKAAAAKHLADLRSAQNQNELVQQLASSKSPTDQTSLAFKALGLDLPDGVHRINETELNAIRNQGGLGDRAYRALLNWSTGQQFAPDILQDISNTASKIAASKVKNANDNLEDAYRIYGYKSPGANERGRFEDSATQGNGGGGSPQTHKFSLSAWKKANPQGDQNAAEAAARTQGYEVVP